VVLNKVNDPIDVLQVPLPELGPRDILIRVVASSICHSDLMLLRGELPFPIPQGGRIMGHEAAGIIVALSDQAKARGFKIGDRCGGSMWENQCLECERCTTIVTQHCEQARIKGINGQGCMCEYTLVDLESAVKIPGKGEDDLASIAPLFCAGITVWDAIKQANIKEGQWLAIVGAGGLGHLAIQMATKLGYRVIAIDVHDAQLELAKSLGAVAVVKCGESWGGTSRQGKGNYRWEGCTCNHCSYS